MKRVIFLYTIFFLISLNGYTHDSFNRVGITIGGTHLVSLSFEHHFGDNSVRIRIGTITPGILLFSVMNPKERDISIATTFNHYFSTSSTKPFIGIGIWDYFVSYKSTESVHFINMPVGVDWKTSNRGYIGLEGDISYPLIINQREDRKVNLYKGLLPIPAFYYKTRL